MASWIAWSQRRSKISPAVHSESLEAHRFKAILAVLGCDAGGSADNRPAELRAVRTEPSHPSLHFKQVGKVYSVRVGLHYRALGLPVATGVHWFWIGTHAEYDRLVG